jgi:glycosyltransferase involved in cell wall biosynthesis
MFLQFLYSDFMHVVFLSAHCDPQADLGEPDAGGQCVYEHELAKALSKRHVTVSTFCRDTGRRKKKTRVNDHYTIYRVPCGPEGFIPKEEIAGVLPEFSARVMTILTKKLPDIIHAHYWDGGKSALHIKKILPTVPLVWTPHSLGILKRRKFVGTENEQIYNFIPRLAWENYTLFSSQNVIVSSTAEKQVVIDSYSLDSDRISVVPPGTQLKRLERIPKRQARVKLGFPTDGKILLCLGRLSRTKNYEQAIRVLKDLNGSISMPVYLAIVGGSAQPTDPQEIAYKNELIALAQELGLEAFVIFHPAVGYAQINAVYSSADVHLMVAKHEPYGLTIIESMAARTPVIAFNSGGAASIIAHNMTGSLVDSAHPERMAGYVRTFLRDSTFATTVTNRAHGFVEEQYGWDQRLDEYMNVYESALKAKDSFSFDDWVSHNDFLRHNLMV